MIRFTVIYTLDAQDDLAREWIDANDREFVTYAGDEIERQLRYDATTKGEDLSEGLRRLEVEPLVALFTVEEKDRQVTVWSIRRARHEPK